MENLILDNGTRTDIDKRVARILLDVGIQEPPLCLDAVREILELDRKYYSTDDPGLFASCLHKCKITGKQLARDPGRLIDVIKNCSLKALWIPKTRSILIDESLPDIKKRWGEAHEMGHSILPWHEGFLYGDPDYSLNPMHEERIEGEANYVAGQLLFLRDVFRQYIDTSSISIEGIQKLSKVFKNSITTTLWRTIECLDVPCFGMVRNRKIEQMSQIRHWIQSQRFKHQFSNITAQTVYLLANEYANYSKGPAGNSTVFMPNLRGENIEFQMSFFDNSYYLLVFGIAV